MGEKRKTAIYLRLSLEDSGVNRTCQEEKESGSIRSQRKYLLDYIKSDSRLAGSEVLEFCDDGFSGTSMERPRMQEMLEQVKRGRIGCILVKDMSRFSRDYIEMGDYLNQIFPFMGVDFIAVNDGYDSRKGNGGTIALDTAFQTLLYDLYSKDISVKMRTAIESKCAAGEYVFGQTPLGYAKSRDKKNAVVINEKEAGIVRHIFAMAAEGIGTVQIAKRLYEEKIPTATQLRYPDRAPMKENLTWSAEAVRNILNNRFYLGEMAYGKSVRKAIGKKTGIALPKSDWKVIENHHEPLISPEIFARAAVDTPGHSTKRKREKHPLIGKIYCGGCGYSLNYKPKGKGRTPRHFWCRKHSLLQIPDCCTYFNAALLEEIILLELNHELMRRGDFLRQQEALGRFQKDALEELDRKRKGYRKQYYTIRKERDGLYERYAAGQMDAQEYRARTDDLTSQMEELSDKADGVVAEYECLKEEKGKNKQDMKQIIRYSHLEELTQDAVDVFIKKVTAYKGRRIEIEWNFDE